MGSRRNAQAGGGIHRRHLIQGALTTGALFICEAVTPAIAKSIVPTLGCGCPRLYPLDFGHTCTIHDTHGKRWDAYTFEEIVAGNRAKIDVQTETTGWSCYCGRHKRHPDWFMPVGMRCVWERTSYEYDEWECSCEDAYRQSWLNSQTIDWHAMVYADELLWAKRGNVK